MGKRTRISVSTRQYVQSHMREPRGRGLWWFKVQNEDTNAFFWTSFTGTYTEARAAARWAAKEQFPGARIVIHVGP